MQTHESRQWIAFPSACSRIIVESDTWRDICSPRSRLPFCVIEFLSVSLLIVWASDLRRHHQKPEINYFYISECSFSVARENSEEESRKKFVFFLFLELEMSVRKIVGEIYFGWRYFSSSFLSLAVSPSRFPFFRLGEQISTKTKARGVPARFCKNWNCPISLSNIGAINWTVTSCIYSGDRKRTHERLRENISLVRWGDHGLRHSGYLLNSLTTQ